MKGYERDWSAKSDSELSDYKKEIEATDNVILCVAKAEKMVGEIGRSLLKKADTRGDAGAPRKDASDQGPLKDS